VGSELGVIEVESDADDFVHSLWGGQREEDMGYALLEASAGWVLDPFDAVDRFLREPVLLFNFL